jgi:hypothetical protein
MTTVTNVAYTPAWRLPGWGPDGSALQMAHESTDVAQR